jgi:hypothetical protein
MKLMAFWILDACVLFALSLVYLSQGYHRKNQFFTVWLCSGVIMQLIASWGLAAGWPVWMDGVGTLMDAFVYLVSAAVLVLAVIRRDCPVNRALLWGLGAMLALNLFARALGTSVAPEVRTWLRNIAFLGPALFMLLSFSNLRLDQLPLWVNGVFRSTNSKNAVGMALTARSLRGVTRPSQAVREHPRRLDVEPSL